MATETNLQKVESWVDKYATFIKAHEKIVIAGLVFVLGLLFIRHYFNYADKVDSRKNQVAQQALKSQTQQTTIIAQQATQQAQVYKQIVSQVVSQNAALEAQIVAASHQASQAQAQTQVEALPLVVAQWKGLLGLLPTDPGVQSTASGFQVSDSAGRNTVSQLQRIPALTTTVKNQADIISNNTKQIAAQTTLVTDLGNVVSGLRTQLSDASAACTANVKALKASARKGKLHWFERGAAVGAAIVVALVVKL